MPYAGLLSHMLPLSPRRFPAVVYVLADIAHISHNVFAFLAGRDRECARAHLVAGGLNGYIDLGADLFQSQQ
jgi:hypothetical protein